MSCQYHSAYLPLGPQDGTEYTPQWMKMPNLASWYHPGMGRVSRDAQVASYVLPSCGRADGGPAATVAPARANAAITARGCFMGALLNTRAWPLGTRRVGGPGQAQARRTSSRVAAVSMAFRTARSLPTSWIRRISGRSCRPLA